jgi:uncharacterized membrane protein
MSDNLYAVGRMVYIAEEVIVELNSKVAALIAERDELLDLLRDAYEEIENDARHDTTVVSLAQQMKAKLLTYCTGPLPSGVG